MRTFLLTAVMLSLPLCGLFCADAVDGTVKANELNVRVKPGDKYAVAAQLSRNEKVKVLNFEKGWYEIAAPAKSSVWISTAFVKDGAVVKKAQLRTGPSVACAPYGMQVQEGTAVEVLDSSQEGWLRISPPAGLTGWVNAEYVDVAPVGPGTQKTEKKEGIDADKMLDMGKGGKKDAVSAKEIPGEGRPAFTGAAPKVASYEGFLIPVEADPSGSGVTHALASRTDGQYFPLCYVYSKKMNLKLWEGRKIQATGQERWIKNWHRPVVELEMVNTMGAL